MRFSGKSQSILEYVVLVSIISAAVVAMATYFQRAMQARTQQIQEEYSPPSRGL